MANRTTERYSIAYFLCPSYDSLIGSCREPSIYRKFTFGEYRSQVQEDVKKNGYKVGLPRFLVQDIYIYIYIYIEYNQDITAAQGVKSNTISNVFGIWINKIKLKKEKEKKSTRNNLDHTFLLMPKTLYPTTYIRYKFIHTIPF